MLRLIQTAPGTFDLAYSTLDTTNDALQTIIYAALFTDQLAISGRVDDPYDQRGWYFDPQAGSGWWYVRRQALSDNARRDALNMAKNALESASDLLTNIEVTEVQEAGNISRVVLQITGLYDGRAFTASSGNFTISEVT